MKNLLNRLNKKGLLVLGILIIGIIATVYLVSVKQIFKSRATVFNNPFDVLENDSALQSINCNGLKCTTKSLKIIIRPKIDEDLPSQPVGAYIE